MISIKLVSFPLLLSFFFVVFLAQFVVKMTTNGEIIKNLDAKGIRPGSADYRKSLQDAILSHFGILEENLTTGSTRKLFLMTKKMASESGKIVRSANNFHKIFTYEKNKVSLNFDIRKDKLKS